MKKILPFIIFLLFGLAIYSNSFTGSFHFDDIGFIRTNQAIIDLTDVQAIWKALPHPVRFVTFYTFALNYHIHQYDVFGYHVVNFIIHLLATGFVYWFVVLLLSSKKCRPTEFYNHRFLLALFCALLFLTHPIQTQAVTYIAQRFAALATMFYVAALCFYMKGRMVNKSGVWFCAAACAGILGMFSKEITFTLPIMILVVEFLFFERKNNKRFQTILFVLALLFLLIIPGLYDFELGSIFTAEEVDSDSHLGDQITHGRYFLTQFRVIVTYIRLLLFPIGQNLDYDFTLSYSLFDPKTFLSFLFLLSLAGLAYVTRKKHVLISFGIIWFFVTLSVESSIIMIKNVIFEHRVYLPSIGFCLILTVLLFKLFRSRLVFTCCLCVIVTVLGFLTFQRNKIWEDEITLWTDVAKKSPNKSRPFLNLGNAYFQKRDFDQALKYYAQAIENDPKDIKVYNSIGVLMHGLGRYHKAISYYNKALAIEPNYAETLINRANTRAQLGEVQQAIVDYNQALIYARDKAVVYLNRGNKYGKMKKYDLALADYNKAIELRPNFFKAYQNRGNLYEVKGLYAQALLDYNKALIYNPSQHDIYFNRGNTFAKMKNFEDAIKDYSQAINIDSNYDIAYYNRSKVFWKQRKFSLALADAQKAQDLGYTVQKGYIEQLEKMIMANK